MRNKDWLFIFGCSLGLLLPDFFTHLHFFGLYWTRSICYSLSFYLAIITVFYAIISIFRNFGIVHLTLKVFLASLVALYAISSIFLISGFDLRWNATTFQLIHDTTPREAKEFLKVFLLDASNWWILVIFVLLGFIFFKGLPHKVNSWLEIEPWGGKRPILRRSLSIAPLVLLVLVYLPQYKCYGPDAYKNHGNTSTWMKQTEMWNVYQGWLYYQLSFEEYSLLAEAQTDLRLTEACSYDSPNIILIIGESYNRHHSSLYGYTRETNPILSQEANLVIYDDVLAPDNTTVCSFQDFLSMASTDDSIKWWTTPLFPAFFKNAGYNVVFWSNQYTQTGSKDIYDAEGGFFNGPTIHPHLFSTMSNTKFSYDMDLIDEYERQRKSIERDSMNFIIFHLLGQHSDYSYRYPSDYEYFTTKDYVDITQIDDNARKIVASYDNATRYNDEVVSHIIDLFREKDAIILYMADHGEEIYDFRNKFGRHYDFVKTGEPIAHCLLDIPFLFYMSDTYRKKHPDIASRVDTCQHRPFMIDDLPHLMLGLAGIKTAYYLPERDLLNPGYNSERKRKINRKNLYYEDVCTSTANGTTLSWIE